MEAYKSDGSRGFDDTRAWDSSLLVSRLSSVVDASLAAMILIAPLFMGGRGPVGQLVIMILSSLAAVAWSAKQTLSNERGWRRSGAEWLLMLGALWIVFQLVPLPQSLLFKLSPAIKDLLPLWMDSGSSGLSLGQWSTLSLTPEFTRGGLTIYLAYVMFFLILLQRLETIQDVQLVLKLIAIATVVMAVLGLAQFFTGSTKFLWVYEHVSRSPSKVVRGAFQNENHFAHFLSLGLGPLLWWLRSIRTTTTGDRRHASARRAALRAIESDTYAQPLIVLSLVVVALAGLLTFSRGGVLTLGVVVIASVAILQWKKLLDRRMRWILSTAALVNLAALMLFGFDSLSFHLGTVFQASSFEELFDTRTDLWNSMCDAISNFWLTGTGVGSHSHVYPTYMEEIYNVKFTHGESGYLPLLLETGLIGLGLMLIGILISLFWCISTLRCSNASSTSASQSTHLQLLVNCAAAILPGVIASILHSIADFVWYIPACMILTIAQLACAARMYQLSAVFKPAPRDESSLRASTAGHDKSAPRGTYAMVFIVLLITGTSMVSNRLGPALGALDWDRYLKNAIVSGTKPTPLEEHARLDAMKHHLVKVLRHNPRDAEAQLRLAAVYLKEFELKQLNAENALDLAQIRDAALASAFSSKEAQDAWLNIAIGDHRKLLDLAQTHSRLAVQLSPLQGLGYVQLANLCFLESPRDDMKAAYIDQAARVRPNDGQVLFIRGKEAALAGNQAEAYQHWKKAFTQDWEIRQILIESLADQVPADFFVNTFGPDTQTLGQLFDRYDTRGRRDEAIWVSHLYVAALQKDAATKLPAEAADCWQRAQATYSWLGDAEKALQCQQRVLDLIPSDFDGRRTFARLLTQQNRYDEAITQYEWCLRRQPDRDDLRNELADAKLRMLQGASHHPIATKPEPSRHY